MKEIPCPIKFNPFKHHRNFIIDNLNLITFEEINLLLDPICQNQIDIYIGNLSPRIISQEILTWIKTNRIKTEVDFEQWLVTAGGYRSFTLSDQSLWILRRGYESARYIHIHPARTGPLRLRFKGATLKTVYVLYKSGLHTKPSLETVNKTREQAGLSSIKKLEPGKGILKCLAEFFE